MEVDWRTAAGSEGSGQVVPFGADDSGLFYFFAALAVVVIPAGAFGLYLNLGTPGIPDQPFAARELAGRTAGADLCRGCKSAFARR